MDVKVIKSKLKGRSKLTRIFSKRYDNDRVNKKNQTFNEFTDLILDAKE